MTAATQTRSPADVPASLGTVLSGEPRPAPPGPLAAALTFGWRALLKIKHVPEQLFDVTAFPVITTLLFTYLFGGALAGSPGAYLTYLLPGVWKDSTPGFHLGGMALEVTVSTVGGCA